MPTQEDRLAALEQKVADIELERLYEQRKAASATPSEQSYDFKQTNHRLTMLLGIASGQEHDIRTIKNDVGIIKVQVTEIKQDTSNITNRLASLEGRFETLEQSVNSRFEAQDKKLDRVLQLLTTLIPKPE